MCYVKYVRITLKLFCTKDLSFLLRGVCMYFVFSFYTKYCVCIYVHPQIFSGFLIYDKSYIQP
jgi:hypothetical protein